MTIQLVLSPRRVWRALLACVAVLVAAHGATLLLKFGFGHDYLLGFARLFDVDHEQNFPSLFSSLQLLACAGLLAAAAVAARERGDPDARYWVGLVVAFVYMGLDETMSIHEIFSEPVAGMRTAAGPLISGPFARYAWVAPYAVVALAFGVAYLGFLTRLPKATAVRFAAAGVAFVAGAVGVEVVEGVLAAGRPASPMPLVVATTAQEIIEMVSISYFITALLRHLEPSGAALEIRLSAPAAEEAPALAAVGGPAPRGWVRQFAGREAAAMRPGTRRDAA